MDDRKATGLKVWTPLIFSLVLIAGMTLGFNLRDTLRNKRDIQTIIERNDRLEQIIDLVNERYVDSVNTNDLYRDAVNGILSHLDPHTIYIPADELQGVNEDLEGSFYGIGVEFAVMRDTILVTSVIPSGPAEKAGIHTGDKIVKVGDSIVAGKDMPSDQVVRMLKGKQNTDVIVGLKDIETGGMKTVTIRRDAIPVYSVDANLMLDEITGYIKISRFSANTYDEFAKAVKSLKASGMQQLIIDVRLNPGGYLESARDIVDDLLPGEKMVVYTKGRNSSLREYKTRDKDLFERGKVAILIDERSASASEILAGAVQDWDRGIIVGRRSYGKGLVQEQYDMDDGAALRLTIAKYYTPSGRSIQRSMKPGNW
jgi:carboxyl-terminal processing protease